MSIYITSPFKPTPKLIVQGTPEYLFGKWNSNVAPTQGNIISDSAVTTTATVTFQILSGNVPVPGALITVVGASRSVNLNVTNAVLLTVSAAANPDAGIYTVTYAITSSSLAVGFDGGQVIIPQPEVGDVITTGVTSSAPVVSPVAGPNSVGKSLSVTVTLPTSTAANPSTLSAVTVVLQGANQDYDSDYNTIATVAAGVAAGTTTDWQSGQGVTTTGTLAAGSVNLPNFRFYRLQVTAATGTGPIIGKILE
jgi:hypothetical protein